jgi:hypothetical protein
MNVCYLLSWIGDRFSLENSPMEHDRRMKGNLMNVDILHWVLEEKQIIEMIRKIEDLPIE